MNIKVGSIFYINGIKCEVIKEDNDKFDVEIDTSNLLTQTQVDELSNQQRLEKVLSKFTINYRDTLNEYTSYKIKGEYTSCEIIYWESKFLLVSVEISLETVESLLKDLEETK